MLFSITEELQFWRKSGTEDGKSKATNDKFQFRQAVDELRSAIIINENNAYTNIISKGISCALFHKL